MREPRPEPIFSRADRMDEVKRYGFYIFCALASYTFTLVTSIILMFRPNVDGNMAVILYVSISAGIVTPLFVYFGAIQKRAIIIPILRIWTITFLTLQTLVFLIAIAIYSHYGIHDPSTKAVDCFVAAGLSLIGLFFGIFGLIRGIRHRWFAHVLVPGYTRG